MRILSTAADAFGPLKDAKLDLARGMTVIYGPNESGKSTWHAALFAGLCGRRRARGTPKKEDREFQEQHRPWEGSEWTVSVEIELDDGRTIQLRHDLERATATAIDLVLGQDVTSEIVSDGAPDGSLWLGLDRRSFMITASVRQAEITAISQHPEALREHLQRAAATAGRDETAAGAISHLKEFYKKNVGLDRKSSSRPLPAARRSLARVKTALEEAREEHDAFQNLEATAKRYQDEVHGADRALKRMEAAERQERARILRDRYDRAVELDGLFRHGEPEGPADNADLEREVAAALNQFETQPDISNLEGTSAEELRVELEALPEAPDGDLEVAPEVTAAVGEVGSSGASLAEHRRTEPKGGTVNTPVGVSADELRELVVGLEARIPEVDPVTRREADQAAAAVQEVAGDKELVWVGVGSQVS